ncbi:MAG: TrkH family potassium uptake protein [Cyclobacteriaceae bacterium]
MKKILSGVGLMLHVPGVMALLSLPIALIFGEYRGAEAFGLTAFLSLLAGQVLYRFFPSQRDTLSVIQVMWVAFLGWTAVSLIGALPFMYIAHRMSEQQLEALQLMPFLSFANSLFESISGYTSTGLTLSISESKLPYSLQWWRSFTQWVGGIGIIVFISAFHPGLHAVNSHYGKQKEEESASESNKAEDQNREKNNDENSDEEEDEDEADKEGKPSMELNWKKIWWVYLLFTVLSFLLLFLQEVPLWEAINHAMTGICTGGFTITDRSLMDYSPSLKLSVAFIMLLGSLNFNRYHEMLAKGKVKQFFTNWQHVLFMILLLGGTVVLYYENVIWQQVDIGWVDTFFQMTSGLGTAGFLTVDLSDWSETALLFLGLVMLIGGATASTTGGVKIFRLQLFVKGNIYNSVYWFFKKEPTLYFRFHNKKYSPDEAMRFYRNTGTFFFFFVTFYFLMTYLLIHNVPDEFELAEIAFESASALGSVGLTTGITGHELNLTAKIVLMLLMLVGRMELVPLIILVSGLLKSHAERTHEA